MLRLKPRIVEEAPKVLLAAGYPEHLARVLAARGIVSERDAHSFLNPSLSDLHDPSLMRDMDIAAARIRSAIEKGERICVYGDYDVDGVCSVSILVESLRAHGADVMWRIPSRHLEGYGLNSTAVRQIAQQASLLITVDCGITSVQEADVAAECGLDLIITDHHEPPDVLPKALAIIDPLLGTYPFRRLCGAGVAFKVAQAAFGFDAVSHLLELAALATVADLVPLLSENRIIVHFGLAQMQSTRRAGLRALIDVCGISGKVITAGHLGFQVGPRINAGGRLEDASRGVELLLTDDDALAQAIAKELDEANQRRQRMEADILQKADRYVAEQVDFLKEKALIVVGEGWNTGVVGLVASRLMDRYAWPAIVLSETDGVLTGSARSISGINLHQALTRCADLFMRFGGHAQAAGMTFAKENLPELRVRLNEAIEDIAEPDAFVPTAQYDLDMELADVTIPLIEQFEKLAPTGFGNPAPVFRMSGAQVMEARGVGAAGKHLKLRLAQQDAAVAGIAFSQGSMLSDMPERIDALFSPSINEFMGKRTPQCEISRILPHEPLETFRERCRQRADDFDISLLDAQIDTAAPMPDAVQGALIVQSLKESAQGTMLIVRTLPGALHWLNYLEAQGVSGRLTYCFGASPDVRRFNVLCAMPQKGAEDAYPRVIALDDARIPAALADFMPTDDALRNLYRVLRAAKGQFASEHVLSEAAGMRVAAVRLGLRAFDELGLIRYRPMPFCASLLPASKCRLEESPALMRVRGMLAEGGLS